MLHRLTTFAPTWRDGVELAVLVQIANAAHLPEVLVERGHDALVDGRGRRFVVGSGRA
ncbi:hypothetical protein ACG2OD_01950 [Streptomyces sp. PDY-4]|uniref:hypothetical protein n=1 Tax=Streptomyces TaxID=1883 RepID=UPI003320333F